MARANRVAEWQASLVPLNFYFSSRYLNGAETMVAWDKYKQEAKGRGSLAMELYVVTSTPEKEPEDIKSVLPSHLAYQAEQEQQGNLFLAGPLSDASGEHMQGTGLIIYRAESLGAATLIAQNDPMHSSGTRSFTIRRWLVNEGSLQLNVKLSEQTVGFE